MSPRAYRDAAGEWAWENEERTMTKLYKLTDEKGRTYGGCQWGENITYTALGNGPLCTQAWLHAYTHPVLAYMLNPIHANFKNPQLWECEGEIGITDHGLKVGCTWLTTIRRLDVATPQIHHRVAFAIGCAYNVYCDPSWMAWAKAWVMNSERAYAAARAAARAAEAAAADAYAAAADAAYAAADADAAYAAAYAAADAADAADAAYDAAYDAAADAARAAAYAADADADAAYAAAAYAANAAAYAANAAANAAYAANAAANAAIPLEKIADWAMTVKP